MFLVCACTTANAQTSAFTYQGKLNDDGSPVSGAYQFQFKLYDAASGGNQIGQTLAGVTATVNNGVFAVSLDFGANSFDGSPRYLEIGVRPDGSPMDYTILNPRHAVTSTPYAVKSLKADQANTANTANTATTADNAAKLGGVPAAQYVQTNDSRLSDARTPLPGSANYIQNTIGVQPSSNFHISGNGSVDGTLYGGNVNSGSQYNILGKRVLASSFNNANVFVGENAGQNVNNGNYNTFVGRQAGYQNSGSNNSIFGSFAGSLNLTGEDNSFFGYQAGYSNSSGNDNAFFGKSAGYSNTTGSNNAFFGKHAGNQNTTGTNNAFFGESAGFYNTTGFSNSFFGQLAGYKNTTGNSNAFFGASAGEANTVGGSNSFFGNKSGEKNTTGNTNSFFGEYSGQGNTTGAANSFFGKNAGAFNTTGSSNLFAGRDSGFGNTEGNFNTFVGLNSGKANTTGDNNTTIGANANVGSGNLQYAAAIGAGAVANQSNSIILGRSNGQDSVVSPGSFSAKSVYAGTLAIGSLYDGGNGGQGSYHLCWSAPQKVVTYCSSSIRYKTNVQDFTAGLDVINRLRPVTYDWKLSGERDLGFIAEEVNQIEPLLTVYNEQGNIQGVKYEQISTVLVNAIKEQQQQIKRQQEQIEALKALVCANNKDAAVCQK